MITTGEIREFQPGVFSLMLEPCSALVLPHILSAEVPFVWLEEHTPDNRYEWWKAQVPLRRGGQYFPLKVRLLRFDLMLPTEQFLTLLPEFADAGMLLLQLEREMPNGLIPRGLKDTERYKVLGQNGLHLEFDLPHAGEYASVISPHRAVLERIKSNPIIASGNLP
jgi:hypothetical protein